MSKDRLVSRVGLLSSVALLAAGSGTQAQEPNPQLSGFISETLEAGTNLGLEPGNDEFGWRSITTLGLGFLSETETQTFALDASVAGRSRIFGDDSDKSDDFKALPTVELFYGIEGTRTGFELDGYYRLDEVDEDTFAQEYLISGKVIRSLTPGLSVNARAGYRSDGAENDGELDTTESLFFDLGAEYEGKLWVLGAAAGVRVFEDVVRPSGEITALRETARGNVSGFIGLDTDRDADVSVVGGLATDYALNSTNVLSASLDQRIAVNQDGDDELRSTARLALKRDLTNRSSAEIGASFFLRNGLNDSDIDNLPGTSFDLGYNYALSERADLVMGYEYTYEEEETGPSTTSHIVSVGISIPFGL